MVILELDILIPPEKVTAVEVVAPRYVTVDKVSVLAIEIESVLGSLVISILAPPTKVSVSLFESAVIVPGSPETTIFLKILSEAAELIVIESVAASVVIVTFVPATKVSVSLFVSATTAD